MPYESSIVQNERKSYQMHHIMRERREASITVENMVTGTQNEGIYNVEKCIIPL